MKKDSCLTKNGRWRRTLKTRKKVSLIVTNLWKDKKYREHMVKVHTGKKQTEEQIRKRVTQFSGDKCHLWRGGITPLIRKIRNCWSMQKWIRDVKNKSKVCIGCGGKDKLEADHIKSFKDIMDENKIKTFEQAINCKNLWNINNGRVLCKECHLKTKSYGNKNKRRTYI